MKRSSSSRLCVQALFLLCPLLLAVHAFAEGLIKVGSTRQEVIDIIGKPFASMKQGNVEIMQYDMGVIELTAGKVTKIDPQFENIQKTVTQPATSSPARQTTPSVQKDPATAGSTGKAKPATGQDTKPKEEVQGPGFFAGIMKSIAGLFGPSEAVAVYQKYAEHMTRGQYEQAKPLATGPALKKVEMILAPAPANRGSGPAALFRQISNPQAMEKYRNQMLNEIAGPVEKVSFKIESETSLDNGARVVITAVQSVMRVRPGSTALRGAVTTSFKHSVEVKKDGDKWKVSSLEEAQVPDKQ